MNLHNQVSAEKETFMDFIHTYPSGTPVTMVNILKFKELVDGGTESGADAYKRYSQNVAPLVAKVGGKMIWGGKVRKTIIGDSSEEPDLFLIVEYPSKEAFIQMSTSEEYKKIGGDRTIALEYGGLFATDSLPNS